jgi:hypothetical protein
MTTSNRLAYVQARLQARHGRRPTDDRWRLLEATPDLAGYLQAARATSLRPWVVHLPADSGTHQVERSLRRDWKNYVAEISRWLPAAWRPATTWLDTLPDLPFFLHLVRGEAVPRWMLEDPLLTEIAQTDPEQRREALEQTRLSRIAAPLLEGTPPVAAWLDGWQREWPAEDAADMTALRRLRQVFRRHISTILEEPLEHPPGPALRRQINERFNMAFRRESGRIAAVFAHFGLMALDLERLRGGLVLRALFPDPAERPQWA